MNESQHSALDFSLDDTLQEQDEETTYEQFLRLWQNEKHAPELLPYSHEVVQALMLQVTNQQSLIDSGAIDKPDVDDFDLSNLGDDQKRNALGFSTSFLHQMDLERIRFTLADYHKTRLQKIQSYAQFLLQDQDAQQCLSPKELVLAEKFSALELQLFQANLLKHLPEELQSIEQESLGNLPGHNQSMIPKPDLDVHVFCRVRHTIGDFRTSEEDDPITLDPGDIYFILYRPLRPLIEADKIELI